MKKIIAKITLLGDGAVGKTSLIRRYVSDQFQDEYIQTIGTKVTKKEVEVEDAVVRFLIWDVLGQIKEHRLHGAYYSGALGGLIVSDYTRRETLGSVPQWEEGFRNHAGDGPLICLLNKDDLERSYTEDDAKGVFSGEVLSTSAKTGLNVERAFTDLAKMIVRKRVKK